MTPLVVESELYRSCEILFGANLHVSRDFLQYLQLSGIKSAYRRRVRETHPDLIRHRDAKAQRQGADLFCSVQEAYENLCRYLEIREQGFRFPASTAGPARAANGRATGTARRGTRTAARPAAGRRNGGRSQASATAQRWHIDTEGYYNGPLPQRSLLFGHFLYYSGVVHWRSIIQALVWQRTQRPRMGELGRRLGWLSERDIYRVMEVKTPTQPFGKSAVRLGLLKPEQVRSLLMQQRRRQKKIGQYFVESRLLTPQALQRHVARFQAHNVRYGFATLRTDVRGGVSNGHISGTL